MTRGNNFDALRLLGALAVLVTHQCIIMGLSDIYVVGRYGIGRIGVFLFFAVSGYLVAGSWKADPNALRYMARRTLRMGPGWLMLMSITGLIALGGITAFSSNAFHEFNASLWTLKWEILCYVALATFAMFVPSWSPWIILAGLLVWWKFSKLQDGPELCILFCAGLLLRTYGFPRRSITLILLGFGGILALTLHSFAALVILVPSVSIWIGVSSWPVIRRAGRYGDFSYGLYIYGWPVQQFGVMWLGKDQPWFPMFILSLLVTGVLAILSWHFVESPALAFKRYLKPEAATDAIRL